MGYLVAGLSVHPRAFPTINPMAEAASRLKGLVPGTLPVAAQPPSPQPLQGHQNPDTPSPELQARDSYMLCAAARPGGAGRTTPPSAADRPASDRRLTTHLIKPKEAHVHHVLARKCLWS